MTSTFIADADVVRAWMAERIPEMVFFDDAKFIGHLRDGQLAGGVAYERFTANSCCMHVASDGNRRWLTRPFLFWAFHYPFLQCGSIASIAWSASTTRPP